MVITVGSPSFQSLSNRCSELLTTSKIHWPSSSAEAELLVAAGGYVSALSEHRILEEDELVMKEITKLKEANLGATSLAGQRFIQLRDGDPWFDVTTVTGSDRAVGLTYGDAAMLIPESMKSRGYIG